MISLACTHCKTVLSMDDAFAGGVCRCQHCGTIQTVPSHLAPSQGAAQNAAPQSPQAASSKQLYRNRAHGAAGNGAAAGGGTALTGASGSGLDEIANIVASSGLSSQRLLGSSQKPHPTQKAASGGPSAKDFRMLLIAAGAVIVILLALVLWFALGSNSSGGPNGASVAGDQSQSGGAVDSGSSAPAPGNNAATPAVVTPAHKPSAPGKPSFVGTDLTDAPTVVYVLDRGNATQSEMDSLKLATLSSIRSLGPVRKFAVIFWNNDENKNPDVMFPASGLASAGAGALPGCRKVFDTVYAFGQSDVKSAMEEAVALRPSLIVLATGKIVDDDFSKEVLNIAKGQAKIDVFSLNLGAPCTPLNTIATQTGGIYRDIPDADLQNAAD